MTPVTFDLDRYSPAEVAKLLQGLRIASGLLPCETVPCTECPHMALCFDLMDKIDYISTELRCQQKSKEAAQ